MDHGSEFSRLEGYIGKLLKQYDEVVVENGKLQQRIIHLEEEIDGLQSAVRSADSERGDISSRIKGLIEKIEDWEATLDSGFEHDDGQLPESVVDHETAVADSPEESEEEKEKNQQQNLFNVEPRVNNYRD